MGELRNVLGGNAAMTLRIRQPGWQAALLAADYSKSQRRTCELLVYHTRIQVPGSQQTFSGVTLLNPNQTPLPVPGSPLAANLDSKKLSQMPAHVPISNQTLSSMTAHIKCSLQNPLVRQSNSSIHRFIKTSETYY